MLKIGIFGAGHLGKIHMQQWQEIADVKVIGFYDPNDEQAAAAIAQYQIPRYTDINELIKDADALDIVTTTTAHYEIAKTCLLSSKHLFIEKPLTHSLEEAQELVKLVSEAKMGRWVEKTRSQGLSAGRIRLNLAALKRRTGRDLQRRARKRGGQEVTRLIRRRKAIFSRLEALYPKQT